MLCLLYPGIKAIFVASKDSVLSTRSRSFRKSAPDIDIESTSFSTSTYSFFFFMNRQFGRGDFYFRLGLGDKSDVFRVNVPEKIALDELPQFFTKVWVPNSLKSQYPSAVRITLRSNV